MRLNLFNARNPNGKRVPITVTIEQSYLIETKDGDDVYLIGLHLGAIGINGKKVDPIFLHNVTKDNILNEISKGLSLIGTKINWGILEEDTYSPTITSISPKDNEKDVSIDSHLRITLTDPFPASFIDKESINLKVNGFDITDKLILKEKQNELRVTWVPIKVTS